MLLRQAGFPDSSVSKEFACNVGDPGLIPGEEDPLEKATHSRILAWSIPGTVHGVTKSRTRLSAFHFQLPLRQRALLPVCKPGGYLKPCPTGRAPLTTVI